MKLSVIILTKNEKEMIKDCLSSVIDIADEIIVIDDESTDKTLEIAKSFNAKIFIHKKVDFANQRNFGLSKATGDWILYLDADERPTPELKQEINQITRNPELVTSKPVNCYYLKRQNYYLGYPWPYLEKIQRLFKKESLKGWYGELHESPIIEGKTGTLKNNLIHFTHRDLTSMLNKTIEWSKIEAELRFKAGHPQVCWWRFLRVMLTQFWNYYIIQKGYKAGTVGIIESFYQAFSIFMTYARLYELQSTKLQASNNK